MGKANIGFIGLGAMGAPMARRLLDAGFAVTSCANRNRAPIEALAPFGIVDAATPKGVAGSADVLVLVVWDEEQIDRILHGEDGALSTLRQGAAVFLMSTISPDYCRKLGQDLARQGITVFDCPLAGMPAGAEAGTLSLMIGGEEAQIEPHRSWLEVLGTIYPCGPLGAGQAVKLANNAMFIGNMGLLLELREMTNAQGVDFETFLRVLNNSTGRSFVSENIPLPPTRTIAHPMAQKDISQCLAAGAKGRAHMPLIDSILHDTLEVPRD